MAEFKNFEEMREMTESEVIQYSCKLMEMKFKIWDRIFDRFENAENFADESKQITEQLRLLSKARSN